MESFPASDPPAWGSSRTDNSVEDIICEIEAEAHEPHYLRSPWRKRAFVIAGMVAFATLGLIWRARR